MAVMIVVVIASQIVSSTVALICRLHDARNCFIYLSISMFNSRAKRSSQTT